MHDAINDAAQTIATVSKRTCLLCGQPGKILYADLTDKLFSSAGLWSFKKCVNPKCGLAWLDPAPRETELWKLYVDYYTHADAATYAADGPIKRCCHFIEDCYLALKFGYFKGLKQCRFRWLGIALYLLPVRRANLDPAVMYLPSRPCGNLLEIGCGNGAMLKHMEMLGWQTEGIDFDPAAVEKARSKGMKINLGSLNEQKYKDNTFDAVILSHVIEHVADPLALLSEIRRILKPGGKISLVTPNVNSFGRYFWGNSWLALDPPRHLFLFNDKSLLKSAQMAGFKKPAMTTTVRNATGIFYASFMLNRNGKFEMGTQPRGMLKLILKTMSLAEWALLKIFRNKGEEISFIGIK
jgi:2-polyprenyl-3-methyl-5-hydroxy-6-metoxy-1,4-benzoquinol methylase